ncbi:hypothetical protein DV735_g1666, partial [Chaetothyriales sp. CBS 134920]
MAHPFQAATGYGAPFASGFYPYQPYGPQQTVPAPASAPSPSSYSPHPMAQSQLALPAPPQPPSANFGHFDANSQRFPFPAPFHADVLAQFATPPALPPLPLPPPPLGFPPIPLPNLHPVQFPPAVVPANPSAYPPQPSGNATDDDDAYDPRYPQHIISPRQPDQAANGPSTRQGGGQEQSRTPIVDPIAQAENTGKAANSDNTHPVSQKSSSHPTADGHKDGVIQQPSTVSGESHPSPAAALSQPFQRHYEHSTGPELRRLAKGALLSLSHHNIHYADLVKEGINQQVLASLYEELHIDIPPSVGPSDKQTEGLARRTPAGNPGLERKDRIAQLLAAKAARASPTRAAPDSGPAIAIHNISQTTPANVEPVASSTATNIAASIDTAATRQTETVEAVHVEFVAAPVGQPTTDQVEESAQISPLDNSATTPLSSLIPGLFMTSDDPIKTTYHPSDDNLAVDAPPPVGKSTPISQKRRRSSHDLDQASEPVSKRQNTTSDLDEGEVMAIDSPSEKDKDVPEAKACDSETAQAPAIPPLEKPSSGSSAQLERKQSAPEVPSLGPRTQTNESAASQPAAAPVAKPFGKSPVTSMTPAQISERAEMLKARFLRQRAERQKALQDGLPGLEAEVSKARALLTEKQDTLSQVNERIQKLKAEISDLTQQREVLGDEISQIEVRLQDGLSGERRLRDELRKLGVEKNTTSSKDSPVVASPAPKDIVPTVSQSSEVEKQVEVEPAKQTNIPERVSEEPEPEQASSKTGGLHDQPQQDEPDYSHTNGTVPNSSTTTTIGDIVGSDKRHNAAAHDPAGDQEGDLEPVDGYDSDGSASMSDSGSEEEYEPADAASQEAMEIDDALSDEYDPEEAPLHPAPASVPEDENANESGKPENANQSGKSTPSAGPADQSNVDKAADDLASEGEVVETTADEGPGELPNGSSDVRMSNTDLPAPQPSPRSRRAHGSSSGNLRPLSNEAPNQTVTFTPYQSPLNSLKAFRYNQQLNDPTEDGFRSLTISNTIDPNVPLCPTELSGAECQDRSCREQHFRRFQLTDEQILVQMSKPDDIGDQAAKDEFAHGLKALIGQLRSRGIKEFEQVATELSKYRRDFYAPRTGL